MDTAEIIVLLVGVALIAFVLVYFFGKRDTKAAAVRDETRNAQIVDITVKGGYEPNVIEAKAGSPLILRFHREENSACSEEVVLQDFGISRHLPAFKVTEIELTPEKAGEFAFTCGMNMLHGRLIVSQG